MKSLQTLGLTLLLVTSAAQAQPELFIDRIITVEPSPGKTADVSVSVSADGKVSMTGIAPGTQPHSFSISIPRTAIPDLEAVLKKSVEWQGIATKNNVMPFEKTIGTIGTETVRFTYYRDDNQTRGDTRTQLSPYNLHPDDAPVILKVLPQIPALEKELNAKIARAKKEYDLFK